jgi:hypothetical protein
MKTIEEKAKAYDEKVSQAKEMLKDGTISQNTINYIQHLFPELVESEDKKWRSWLIGHLQGYKNTTTPQYSKVCDEAIAWLQKQGEQINLIEVLKHYPKETELYCPLYGRLWLAEVDEKNGIIVCYKHHLENGCTRATLEQEDTISFYSNGTTGLPDCTVSKDCMLFLYEKQDRQKPAECSEKDEEIRNFLISKMKKVGNVWKEYSAKDIIAWLEKQNNNTVIEKIKQLKQQLLHEKEEADSFLESFSLCDKIANLEKLLAYINKN